jgi:hypothetical protein
MRSEAQIKNEFRRLMMEEYPDCRVVEFSDPARRGAPDRLVLMPGGEAIFVEFKRPEATTTGAHIAAQRRYIEALDELGFIAFIATSAEEAVSVIRMRLMVKCGR